MPLIPWNDSLSVHIDEIDRQHQKLVGMINNLNDAMLQGKGKNVTGAIVHDLIAYAGTHFTTEETFFSRYGYPDAAAHTQEHARFVQQAKNFQRDYDAGKIGLSVEVMKFLSSWLQEHIQGSDRKYAPYLNAKGVK
jgi:hemerythrin